MTDQPPPAATSLQPWGTPPSSDEGNLAMMAHLSVFVLPILGPAIVWLLKKDQSRFVGYHALQATLFQLVTAFLSTATCGVGLLLLVMPLWIGLRAQKGEWAGYPLLESAGR